LYDFVKIPIELLFLRAEFLVVLFKSGTPWPRYVPIEVIQADVRCIFALPENVDDLMASALVKEAS
jgi:uncharacterized membrane protein (UPF0127 family)